jgi:hypothetical protein
MIKKSARYAANVTSVTHPWLYMRYGEFVDGNYASRAYVLEQLIVNPGRRSAMLPCARQNGEGPAERDRRALLIREK